MASLVYFKFKSNLSFDTIQFDGSSISVRELRNAIRTKCSLRSNDYDLKMQDSNGKEYTNEDELISKYTSVIVRRVPKLNTEPQRKKIANPEDMTKRDVYKNLAGQTGMKFHQISKATNLANSNLSEDQKIKLMMEQASDEYTEKNYLVKPKPYGIPPVSYVCRKCNTSGHWIHNCQGIKDKAGRSVDLKSVRRPTGIPQDSLLEVEAGTPGAYFAKNGRYVVPIKDAEAYALGKKEKRPFSQEENPPYVPKTEVVPDSLKCPLCHNIFKDAVLVCCCCSTYCNNCIMDYVFDSSIKGGNTCPNCNSKISDNESSILENSAIRNLVLQWQSGNQTILSKPEAALQPTPPKVVKEETLKDEKVFVNNRRVLVPKASPAKLIETAPVPSTVSKEEKVATVMNEEKAVTISSEKKPAIVSKEEIPVVEKQLQVTPVEKVKEINTTRAEETISQTPTEESLEIKLDTGELASIEVQEKSEIVNESEISSEQASLVSKNIAKEHKPAHIIIESKEILINTEDNKKIIEGKDENIVEKIDKPMATEEPEKREDGDKKEEYDSKEVHSDRDNEDAYDSNAESVLNSELEEADDKVTVITKPPVNIVKDKSRRSSSSDRDKRKREIISPSSKKYKVDIMATHRTVDGGQMSNLSGLNPVTYTTTEYQQALLTSSYATYSQNYYQQHGLVASAPIASNPYAVSALNPYMPPSTYLHQLPFSNNAVQPQNVPVASLAQQFPVCQTYPGVTKGPTMPLDTTIPQIDPFANPPAQPILSEEQFYLMKAKLLKNKKPKRRRRSISPKFKRQHADSRRSRSPREKWKPPLKAHTKIRSRSPSPGFRRSQTPPYGIQNRRSVSPRQGVRSPLMHRRSPSRTPSYEGRWSQSRFSPSGGYSPRLAARKKPGRRSPRSRSPLEGRHNDRSPSYTPSPKLRVKGIKQQPLEESSYERGSRKGQHSRSPAQFYSTSPKQGQYIRRSRTPEREMRISKRRGRDNYSRVEREEMDPYLFYKYMQEVQMINYNDYPTYPTNAQYIPATFDQYADLDPSRRSYPKSSHIHGGYIPTPLDEPSTSSRHHRRVEEIANDGGNASAGSSTLSQDQDEVYQRREHRKGLSARSGAGRTDDSRRRQTPSEKKEWPSDGQDVRRVRKPVDQKEVVSKVVKKPTLEVSTRKKTDHDKYRVDRNRTKPAPSRKLELSNREYRPVKNQRSQSYEEEEPERSDSPTPERSRSPSPPPPVAEVHDRNQRRQQKEPPAKHLSPTPIDEEESDSRYNSPISTAKLNSLPSSREDRPRMKSNVQKTPVKSSTQPSRQTKLLSKSDASQMTSDNHSETASNINSGSQKSPARSVSTADSRESSPVQNKVASAGDYRPRVKSKPRQSPARPTRRHCDDNLSLKKRRKRDTDKDFESASNKGYESKRCKARSTSLTGSQPEELIYPELLLESDNDIVSPESNDESSPRNGPISSKVLKINPSDRMERKRKVEVDEEDDVELEAESDTEKLKKHKKKHHRKSKKHHKKDKKHKKHRRKSEKDVNID